MTRVTMVLNNEEMARDIAEALQEMSGRPVRRRGRVIGYRSSLTPVQLEAWARNTGWPIEHWNTSRS